MDHHLEAIAVAIEVREGQTERKKLKIGPKFFVAYVYDDRIAVTTVHVVFPPSKRGLASDPL